MLTHIVVDDLPVCGAIGACATAPRTAAATCAACRAVLLYLGAPASVLLEDDEDLGAPAGPREDDEPLGPYDRGDAAPTPAELGLGEVTASLPLPRSRVGAA